MTNAIASIKPMSISYCQIIAEFERILGLQTSVLETFRSNISQVAAPMLELASGKKSKDIQDLLHLLDPDEWSDADESESTSGKNILYYPLKIYAIQK